MVVGRRGELAEKPGITHETGSMVTVWKDQGAVTGRFTGRQISRINLTRKIKT